MSGQYLIPIQKRIITPSDNTSSIFFTNIPQSFTDLIILSSVRCVTTAVRATRLRMGINNNNSSLFSVQAMGGNASSMFSFRENATSLTPMGMITCGGGSASSFGVSETIILNYSSSLFKNIISITGRGDNTTSNSADFINVTSSQFRLAEPVNTLSFSSENGSNFDVSSSFYIYGRKD